MMNGNKLKISEVDTFQKCYVNSALHTNYCTCRIVVSTNTNM